MIYIQLYRAKIGAFTNIYGVRLERSKGNKGSHLIAKEGSK